MEKDSQSKRPTPIIDLTAARERAELRRKQLESEQKRTEAERRASAFRNFSRISHDYAAKGSASLNVSGGVFRAVRMVQLIFIFIVLAYLAKSCGFV